MAKRQDWIIGGAIGGSALFLIVLLMIAFSRGFDQTILSTEKGSAKIAVIEVKGPIFDARRTVEQLKQYQDDETIPAIVLRIESPGGGIVASQEIYAEIQKTRRKGKKVVVSMGSVAASGGYYIATAADTIVANPGTITGSIGVIAELTNAEKLFQKIGLGFEVIKSGQYKDMGSPSRQLTDEERSLLQGVIDDSYDQFIDAIIAERGIERGKLLKIADGRIMTGRQALEHRLVDVLGDYEDAIDLAAHMVGMKEKPQVVKEKKKRLNVLDLFFDGASDMVQGWFTRSMSLNYLMF
ncbi:MAG: signal peptide peptidase SppA [Candidatus Latescibacteria bacterium]|nr:signal peptide peptidase SppA [Candidatus Latescibacterota bacterium]